MLYRLAANYIADNKYQEAFESLENALILDFEKHTVLLEFFSNIDTQKALFKIIEKFRKEHSE